MKIIKRPVENFTIELSHDEMDLVLQALRTERDLCDPAVAPRMTMEHDAERAAVFDKLQYSWDRQMYGDLE